MTSAQSPAGPPAASRRRTSWSLLWGRQDFGPEEDPDVAPAGRGRTSDAPRRSWRFGADHGAWSFLVGWIFLLFLLVPALAAADDLGVALLAVLLVLLVGAAYTGAAWMAETPLLARLGYLVAFTALVLGGAWWLVGSFALSMTPYLAVMTAHLVPWRHARIIIVGVGTVGVVAGALTDNWYPIVLSVVAIGMGLLLGAGLENARLGQRLERSEVRVATLAVAAERERIGRDLHDILGHSLTVVAVKAGLASRLATVDPEATREQLQEIEQVARQALADVRATAGGYRQVRLAAEIAGARSVLQASGIRCTAPTALPAMSDTVSEFLGYVVREGVTNVVRHADASAVDIAVAGVELPQSVPGIRVSIADDGRGTDGSDTGGGGLVGLATRAARIGGAVTLTSERGSALVAEVPAAAEQQGQEES